MYDICKIVMKYWIIFYFLTVLFSGAIFFNFKVSAVARPRSFFLLSVLLPELHFFVLKKAKFWRFL